MRGGELHRNGFTHLGASRTGSYPRAFRQPGNGFALRRIPTRDERREAWRGELDRERGCAGHFGRSSWFVGFALAGLALAPDDNADLVVYSTQMLAEPVPVDDTWTSASGEQVEVATSEPVPQEQTVTYNVDVTVEEPPAGVKLEPATYVVVATRLHFRSSPEINPDNTIGYFAKGDNVEVMGRTPDGQWALLGDDGVVVGYAKFEERSGRKLLETPKDVALAEQTRAHPRVKPASIDTYSDDKADIRVAANTNIRPATSLASTQCKTLIATHGTASDHRTACQQPDGGYAIAIG